MANGVNVKFWLSKQTNYDAFAGEFDETRYKNWPEGDYFHKRLQLFGLRLRHKPKVLDAGCGNGRLFQVIEDAGALPVGIDQSAELTRIAQKKYPHITIQTAQMQQLPFADETFDGAAAFASLPHLPSSKAQRTALREMHRTLKPGGFVFGTLWNLNQPQFNQAAKQARRRSLFLPWWSKNDFVIPWGKQKLLRMYHRFSPQRITELLVQAGFDEIEIFSVSDGTATEPTGRNICFIAKKPTRIKVLGVPIDLVKKREATDLLENAATGSKQIFATTPNPEICVAAHSNIAYKKILQTAHLSFADGFGLQWAADYATSATKNRFWHMARWLMKKRPRIIKERVCGADLFVDFCKASRQPIFLLGGAPGVAKKCKKMFNEAGGNIVAVDDGSADAYDEKRIIEKIDQSNAKVLFVAFGAPKQEQWIYRNYAKLRTVRLAVGVGGSFDFAAGEVQRAPEQMRRMGLEWVWRLLQNPRQRAKRIFTAVWVFPRVVAGEKKLSAKRSR